MTTPSNLTDEQLASLLEQATVQPDADATKTPAAPAKLSYRLGSQTFEASSPEELQAQLDEAMNRISQTVSALQRPAAPEAKAPKAPGLDKEKYARLFLDDPMAAQDYLDEIRFGMPQTTNVLKTVIRDVGAMEQSLAVQQFLGSAADYEATPDNFAALSATMAQYQLPWTANGLKLAHTQAKADGRIRASEADDTPAPQHFPVNTRRSAPVVPRGAQQASAAVDADMVQRFESLSPERMRAFLEQLPNA